MRLPAVVDLVLEQVCEQPAEGVGLRPGPAQDADRCVQIERPRMGLAAERDQARVDVPLSLAERRTGGEGRLPLEERAGPLVGGGRPASARSKASTQNQCTVTWWLSVAARVGKKLVRGAVNSASVSAAQARSRR